MNLFNKKVAAVFITIALGLATVVTHAADLALTDHQIVEVMKIVNHVEIEAAKLAKIKAKTSQVKTYAESMVTEHEKSSAEETSLTKRIGIKAKSNDMAKGLKKDAKVNLADLKRIKGLDFDKAFIKMQISMHQGLLNDLDEKLIPAAQNSYLKEYLQTTRAHVTEYLSNAQDVQIDISKN